jgi:hypothetical protein
LPKFVKNEGQSIVYKNPTLWAERNLALEGKSGRRFTKLMDSENRQE